MNEIALHVIGNECKRMELIITDWIYVFLIRTIFRFGGAQTERKEKKRVARL